MVPSKRLASIAAILLLAAAASGATAAATTPAASAPASSPAAGAATDGRLSATISLAHKQFAPGLPVPIHFTVTNVSGKALSIWSRACSWGHEVHSFELTRPNGSTVTLSEPRGNWARNVPSAQELQPGDKASITLNLLLMAGGPLPAGEYTVRGVYQATNSFKGKPDWARLDGLWEGKVVTASAEFSIGTGPAAAAAAPVVTKTVTITEVDNAKTVQATVGQRVAIHLEGTEPATGWEAGAVQGQSILRVGGQPGEVNVSQGPVFTPAKDARNEAIGTYSFFYTAVGEGRSTLRVTYVSPGGPRPIRRLATKLVKEFTVTIEVSAAPAAK